MFKELIFIALVLSMQNVMAEKVELTEAMEREAGVAVERYFARSGRKVQWVKSYEAETCYADEDCKFYIRAKARAQQPNYIFTI